MKKAIVFIDILHHLTVDELIECEANGDSSYQPEEHSVRGYLDGSSIPMIIFYSYHLDKLVYYTIEDANKAKIKMIAK